MRSPKQEKIHPNFPRFAFCGIFAGHAVVGDVCVARCGLVAVTEDSVLETWRLPVCFYAGFDIEAKNTGSLQECIFLAGFLFARWQEAVRLC